MVFMKYWVSLGAYIICVVSACLAQQAPALLPYPIVATGQCRIFSDRGQLLVAPKPDEPFFGQDGFYQGPQSKYRDNGDGTISDLNTGLIWAKARGQKMAWSDAVAGAARCRIGGHTDWRAPTIKELYSLIDFNGGFHLRAADSTPYLDTRYFDFVYGDESRGERGIDCQDWSATYYVSTQTSNGAKAFGVNFADGRIKGYGLADPRSGGQHMMYIRYVRGNPAYGRNDLHDNGNGTISDLATGLMWSKADSGQGMDWRAALAWVQQKDRENYLGHSDWRLPNAKELQSIVDYTRAPTASDPAHRGPAISPLFQVSRLDDGDYPFFWSSTTHLDGPPNRIGGAAVYVAFGRATGWMPARPGPPPMMPNAPGKRGAADLSLMDVHGAGAQRSDPKSGNANDYPYGRGPQGDVIRILNFCRPVRSIAPDGSKVTTPDLTPLPGSYNPLPRNLVNARGL